MLHKLASLAIILTAGLCLTACSNQKVDKDPAPYSVVGVEATLKAYVDGRQARDIPAVVATLDPSVDQLTSRGEWRKGVDASTAGMKRSSKQNPGDRILEIESVRLLRYDVALADARYTIKGVEGKPDRVLWSSFTLVMKDGKWLITSIRNQKPAP